MLDRVVKTPNWSQPLQASDPMGKDAVCRQILPGRHGHQALHPCIEWQCPADVLAFKGHRTLADISKVAFLFQRWSCERVNAQHRRVPYALMDYM